MGSATESHNVVAPGFSVVV